MSIITSIISVNNLNIFKFFLSPESINIITEHLNSYVLFLIATDYIFRTHFSPKLGYIRYSVQQ